MSFRNIETPAVIRTVNLTKSYDGRVTVNKLNLKVLPGEIYGFLGPNGAGKTTTIRMLVGLLPPTSGHVEFFGHPADRELVQIRRRLGVVGEYSFVYDDMTALEYLKFFARFYGVRNEQKRIMELLEQLELAPYAQLLARDFSQGMQKKLSLARALLHEPDLLILDEPVSGLDPYGILQVRHVLQEQRQAGRAIFLSSHILSEVERTADRIGILNKGQLLMEGTMEEVRSKLAPKMELKVELQAPIAGLSQRLEHLAGVKHVTCQERVLNIQTETDLRVAVSQTITSAGGLVVSMEAQEPSLEDVFVKLTEGQRGERSNGTARGKRAA
ncbi:MAG TPA: ABC transporter ATP-binding protein [Anaerolineae bacterium]|nr:ABC transporter ATP-binding protein [Anaerolineae bacterium]